MADDLTQRNIHALKERIEIMNQQVLEHEKALRISNNAIATLKMQLTQVQQFMAVLHAQGRGSGPTTE